MRALRMQVRAELAARWRAWLVLALVAGLAGGVVIATAVCARRTDSALSRYRSFSRAPDVYVGTGLTFGLQALDLPDIRRLPQVRAVTRGILPNADVLQGGGHDVNALVQLEVLPDPDGLEVVDRPKLLAGRLPAPGRPDEVVADMRAMRSAHLALGDTLTVRLRLGRRAVAGAPIALRIVGVRPDMFPYGGRKLRERDARVVLPRARRLPHRRRGAAQRAQGPPVARDGRRARVRTRRRAARPRPRLPVHAVRRRGPHDCSPGCTSRRRRSGPRRSSASRRCGC